MGMNEDTFFEIYENINSKGLQKDFDAQLNKMKHQPKHRFKSMRERWEYAYLKVSNLK